MFIRLVTPSLLRNNLQYVIFVGHIGSIKQQYITVFSFPVSDKDKKFVISENMTLKRAERSMFEEIVS